MCDNRDVAVAQSSPSKIAVLSEIVHEIRQLEEEIAKLKKQLRNDFSLYSLDDASAKVREYENASKFVARMNAPFSPDDNED